MDCDANAVGRLLCRIGLLLNLAATAYPKAAAMRISNA